MINSKQTCHTLSFSFALGQITDEESLFTYPSGLGVADFSDPNHEPPFSDEISVDQDIIDMCGGDSECVFDATVTGDPEIGMTTLMVDGNNTDDFAVGGKLTCVAIAVHACVLDFSSIQYQ